MKCLLDSPEFKYVPASKTDIRIKIRKEMKRLEEQRNEKVAA